MNVQMSRRGREYVKTARTLLRTAQTMTNRVIASRLEALADDYQRRAEKASNDDTATASARSAANSAEREQPREKSVIDLNSIGASDCLRSGIISS
jgi:hypothetical protein